MILMHYFAMISCFVFCMNAMSPVHEQIHGVGLERIIATKRRENKEDIQLIKKLFKTIELKSFFVQKYHFIQGQLYLFMMSENKYLAHIHYNNGLRQSFLREDNLIIDYSPEYCIFLERRYNEEFDIMNPWYRTAFSTLPDLFENVRPSRSM